MKKILGEYSQILGYTFTGLVFGLSFFLLFLNFYHFKEVNTTIEKTSHTDDVYTRMSNNISQVKTNASLYDVNNYRGNDNGYELLSVQTRLILCTDSFDSEHIKKIFEKKSISMLDIYKFEELYQQKIVNDCILKQLYALTFSEGNELKFKSNAIRNIAPFIKLEADSLARSTKYLASNIENNSSYYFGNVDSRNNIFDITKESYYEVLNSYEEASKFLLVISKWYVHAIGGAL